MSNGNSRLISDWKKQYRLHYAVRVLTSDWFINSFMMAVCEKSLFKFNQNILSMTKNIFLLTTIIKLFTDQSEVSALPAGWFVFLESLAIKYRFSFMVSFWSSNVA